MTFNRLLTCQILLKPHNRNFQPKNNLIYCTHTGNRGSVKYVQHPMHLHSRHCEIRIPFKTISGFCTIANKPLVDTKPIPKISCEGEFKDFAIFDDYNFGLDQDTLINRSLVKLNPTLAVSSTNSGSKDDDVDVVDPLFDGLKEEMQKCFTEKGAPAFNTSDDARLDFFSHIVEQTNRETTISLLDKSWSQNATDTLRLVAHLRDITKGKGIRSQFQDCLYWLYQNHPQTLYNNLDHFTTYGYWKDLLHFLTTIYFDGNVPTYLTSDDNGGEEVNPKPLSATKKRKLSRIKGMVYNNLLCKTHELDVQPSQASRKDMNEIRVKYAREKFRDDLKYRAFHVRVAELFAKQLIQDIDEMKKNKHSRKVSLAGKWVPTLEKHFDRYLLISTTIGIELARMLQKDDIFANPVVVGSYLCRRLLHKEFYVPLRGHLQIPEVFMCARKWDELEYKSVPAKCMKLNKKLFIKHDKERLEEYLSKPNKVAGASLKPVEIISPLLQPAWRKDELIDIQILEKQWQSLVDSFKKPGGLLKNSIAVCDVSSSMEGTPMNAAIALTLLTMELTEKPWNSMCITFSERPSIQTVDANSTILSKVQTLKAMEWGGTTNFHSVMKLIVDVATEKKLSQEQLPKLLIVFTDMEFDEAFGGVNTTNFEAVQKLFKDAGYTSAPPILFWNLRESYSTFPVQKGEFGTILMGGYSGQQLGYLSKYDSFDQITPCGVMLDIINTPRYSKLSAFD